MLGLGLGCVVGGGTVGDGVGAIVMVVIGVLH